LIKTVQDNENSFQTLVDNVDMSWLN